MNIPEIRIQTSPLLFNSISQEERQKWADEVGMHLYNTADIDKYVQALRQQWEIFEKHALSAMCELYGIQFKKPIIDVNA